MRALRPESSRGDERLNPSELFFEGSFSTPIDPGSCDDALEAVRWAPSAVNGQPWRVVTDGSSFHFFEKQVQGYRTVVEWDVQKIDVGIAICHFMSVAGGRPCVRDPGIATDEDTAYIATVII